MAGARIEITKDTASPALKSLIAGLQGEGRARMLGDMGEYLLGSTRERAAREVDPDGNKWRALSPAYARWKAKKRPGVPILKFDFHMLGDQLSYNVDGEGLLLGTNAPYGAAHQFGHTYQRAARSQDLFFSRRGGAVGNRFVKKGRSNFAQRAEVGAHESVLPARKWLGVSKQDDERLLEIATDHIDGAFSGK